METARARRSVWWLSAAFASATLCAPRTAHARVVQDERYGVELTWNAVVRLLRVDMGFTIHERDRDAGFVLFSYRDGGRDTPGSVEVLPAEVDGAPGCRVIVQLTQMPNYAERYLVNRLQQKLHADYGDPPPAHRPAAPTQPPPADDDHGTAQPQDPPRSGNAPSETPSDRH